MHYHTVSHVLVFIIPPSSPSLHCVTFRILLQCRSSRRKWTIFHTTTLSFTAQRRVSTLTFHHCCHLRSSSFWKRHRIWGREIVYKKPCLPHLPLLEDLEIGGWTHLHDNIVNHITRRIHNNPYFLPALTLQFEGQGTIFREDQQALEGLHIVCRRLEWDAVEYIVHAQSTCESFKWQWTEDWLDERRGGLPAAKGNKYKGGGKKECRTGPLSAAHGPTSRRVTQNERLKSGNSGALYSEIQLEYLYTWGSQKWGRNEAR